MVKSVFNKVRKKLAEIATENKAKEPVQQPATPRQVKKVKTEHKKAKPPEEDVYRPRESHQKSGGRSKTKKSSDVKKADSTEEKTTSSSAPRRQRSSDQKRSSQQPRKDPNSDTRESDTTKSPPEGSEPRKPRRRRRRGPRKDGGQSATSETTKTPDSQPPPQPTEPIVDNWDVASYVVEPEEGKTRFHDLGLPGQVMHAIADLQFKFCTPIQAELLPSALEGKDAFGKAQTGTGKSAAFLLTILTHLDRKPGEQGRKNGTPRALILAPTRELVMQIEKDAKALAQHTNTNILAVFGGMDYEKQKQHLMSQVVDIMIATPGRLLDFKRKRDLHLSKVEILVIDEADRMLDMGFIPDVRNIIHSTPPRDKRQTLLLSATLTKEVTRLAGQWTKDPFTIEIEPEQVAVDTVDQIIYIVTVDQKFPLLYNMIKREKLDRVMVFVNRRDEVRRLTDDLQRHGIECDMLSGEVNQRKRMKTLEDFREGKIPVLVATDVAGRGIHIDGVSHVVNYTLPLDPEDYVHRIGRTGRAGASGTSVSFASETDSFHIPDIEGYIGRDLPCIHPDDELVADVPPASRPRAKEPPRTSGNRGSGGRGGRQGGGRGPGGGGNRSGGRRSGNRR